jgi:c-di-GMP-related signal transduction protein
MTSRNRLTELVAFIKIDVLAAPALEQQRLAKAFSKTGVQLVAEKVESYDVFERPLSGVHSYFQVYFFNRPEMLTRHDIPSNDRPFPARLAFGHRCNS